MRVKKATSYDELLDVYRLRYKVYCLERGYERPEDYPAGLETDIYDPYSLHFVAYVKSVPVGTVRLILQNPHGFPVERHCNVDTRSICQHGEKVAEISRLAVSSEATKDICIERGKITLGLIRELYSASRELGIGCLVSAMSLPLERLLKRCGLKFLKAGPAVDYHGLRTPYFAACEDLERELFNRRKDLLAFFLPESADLAVHAASTNLFGGRRTEVGVGGWLISPLLQE
ncbi:putative PEP-CTERM/exosortase system-associated acyltransferase [Candidatus Sulfobium mesophilum]|uniref:Putative PEP-CTERM/exosortase system-associated acyltransferase n=1 Tax=Candidatus Sulfobium mesophilum TaxID=2016548 RepID=A0A2U3QDK3_9BACT|nr:putative PEP-CTERM/exosortase system-associated acyltransferase [Candidatus Sulfobium mesophilum]